MATTESRSGFRLPWSVDRSSSTDASGDAEPGRDPDTLDEPAASAEDHLQTSSESTDGSPVPTGEEPATTNTATISPPAAKPSRRPTKFLADLMAAMHAAAEQAHVAVLDQFQGDGRSVVDGIQARSAEQADGLRRRSDEDIAGIKDWSKAEIARIREEAEGRIVARKAQLDLQLERHAALVERQIEKVRGQLAGFERDMEAFFAELVKVEDPSEFAARAEQMPEPPAFEPLDEEALGALLDLPVEPRAAPEPVAGEQPVVDEEPVAAVEAAQESAETEPAAPPEDVQLAEGEAGSTSTAEPFDRETAMAAIQAAAEAAASLEAAQASADRAEVAADRAEVAFELIDHETGLPIEPGHEPVAEATGELASDEADGETEGQAVDDNGHDPRIAMLGLTPDYAGVEDEAAIEAAALREAAEESEPLQEMGEDTLSARLAGLVGSTPAAGKELGPQVTTQIMVTGLISVASIASFKRHLGRLAGVGHVGVSSGPDGEFVFTAQHGAEVSLRELIPALPSFQARVTGGGEGVITVSAHDPDA